MSDPMRRLRPFLLVTDTLFIAYWLVSAMVTLGLLALPSERASVPPAQAFQHERRQ